ncbi:MAG: DUF1232 domain-containing protein [Fibrobacteria bacterium]|nr:DUF1232 domain-containing protein [Fibrobacteria bacterium]
MGPTKKNTKRTTKKKVSKKVSKPKAKKASKKAVKGNVTQSQARSLLNKGIAKVKDKDIEKVVKKSSKLKNTFITEGPFKEFVDDSILLVELVKDYWNGSYREIPYYSIIAVVAALIYVISPVDLIPDFIPVIGYMDDAAVVALCLKMIKNDLDDYRDWKEG